MYLTYSEYHNIGGTLDEPAFNSVIYEAQIKLDYYTYNRLQNDNTVSDRVKHCLAKIVDLIYNFNAYKNVVTNITNPIVSSQSNDGVSVSYGGYLGNTSPNDLNLVSQQLTAGIRKTVEEYLQGETNECGEVLLYRGVYRK